VKFVNAAEGKLLLSLRKIDPPSENAAVAGFKESK
jgi:hypothetical protein